MTNLYTDEQATQLMELMKEAPHTIAAEQVFIDALEATGHFTRREQNPKIYYGISNYSFIVYPHHIVTEGYRVDLRENQKTISTGPLCALLGSKRQEVYDGDDLSTREFTIMMIEGQIVYYDTYTHYNLGMKYITNPEKAEASKTMIKKFFSDDPDLNLSAKAFEVKSSWGTYYEVEVTALGKRSKCTKRGITEDEAWNKLYQKLYGEWVAKCTNNSLIKIGF